MKEHANIRSREGGVTERGSDRCRKLQLKQNLIKIIALV